MQPLISVIVPVYNVEEYLPKCLESIINQTYKNLEIIVIDDGSTDNSGKICDECAERDNRIKVIHKTNGGLSDARNKGMDIAKGDYIGFVDSDDYIAEDMYEYLYNFAAENNLDVAMCASCDVYDDKVIYAKKFETLILTVKNEIIENLFVNKCGGLTISVCNKLFKRNVVANIRFEYNKTSEDVYFVLKWIENTGRFGRSDKQKYYYIQRSNSITHKNLYSDKFLDVVDAYQKNFEIISKKYPKAIKAAQCRLWWAYRVAIEKICACEDWFAHKELLSDLQKVIRDNLIKILKNDVIDFKIKIAYILLSINISAYLKAKEIYKNN